MLYVQQPSPRMLERAVTSRLIAVILAVAGIVPVAGDIDDAFAHRLTACVR